MGVVGAKSNDKLLNQVPLVEDKMCLVLPPDHPLSNRQRIRVRDLQAEPFIIREPGSGTLRSIERQLRKKGLRIDDFNIVAEMGSTESVRQAIKSKVGLSILSSIAVADDVNAGLLKTVLIQDINMKRNFYLITHKQRTPSLLGSTFTTFLKQQMAVD